MLIQLFGFQISGDIRTSSLVYCKGIQLQAWSGPENSRKLRFPYFMTTAQDGGKIVSVTHRPPLPQKIYLVLISARGWVDPRAIVRPKRLCHWKIPMTPSGIEPATCRFVAYCRNHYVTARPHYCIGKDFKGSGDCVIVVSGQAFGWGTEQYYDFSLHLGHPIQEPFLSRIQKAKGTVRAARSLFLIIKYHSRI